jgi:hypothetical protein
VLARWVFSFSRCCYLIFVFSSPPFSERGCQELVAVT